MPPLFNRLVIAGVGLIGGSLGLAARARGLVGEVIGFGRTEANLRVARERGIIDAYTFDPAEAARDADLLLLAVPVAATGPTAEKFIPFLQPGCVLTDAGSTKEQVVSVMERLLPEGVIIRPMEGYGFPGYARVSVGTPAENERFVAAMEKLLKA